MAKLTQEQINDILSGHQKWLAGNGGERADLSDTDLSGANLCDVDLSGAELYGANLSGANLCGANFRGANLSGANFRGVDMTGADLWGTNLSGANLTGADLTGADLRGANLSGVDLTGVDLWGSTGNRKEIKTILVSSDYHINYTRDRLQIGWKNHAINEWKEFGDRRILEMGGKQALKFWRECKDYIFMTIDKFPAE